KELWGEYLGTFILVFIGCGSVGAAVILGWLTSLYQVAAVWGIGVTLAIMVGKRWSPAHFNPAVTLAMCIARHHSWRRLLPYCAAQLVGAIIAGLALLLLFEPSIHQFEKESLGLDANLYELAIDAHDGSTAQMFGEFFPNPGYADTISITWPMAMLAEAAGTFLLLLAIFWIVKDIDRLSWKPALLIGLSVAILIVIFAPYTQCGMNPARDFGPRLVAYFSGWDDKALPSPVHGAISVYVIGPLIGGGLAALTQGKSNL
ncbi:UNVERIFIED_CONTAM: hypothetical protein GTU68_065471, partial [Idotea baltica]|nr:hypothetical protein [Idotea baltica]